MTPRERFLHNVTGTKFMLCFMALSGSMIGAAWGWLDGSQWVATVNITFGIFTAGNVGATVAASKRGEGE